MILQLKLPPRLKSRSSCQEKRLQPHPGQGSHKAQSLSTLFVLRHPVAKKMFRTSIGNELGVRSSLELEVVILHSLDPNSALELSAFTLHISLPSGDTKNERFSEAPPNQKKGASTLPTNELADLHDSPIGARCRKLSPETSVFEGGHELIFPRHRISPLHHDERCSTNFKQGLSQKKRENCLLGRPQHPWAQHERILTRGAPPRITPRIPQKMGAPPHCITTGGYITGTIDNHTLPFLGTHKEVISPTEAS